MKAYTYWLMPSKKDAPRLQAVVDELATEFDAGRFEPHLTLFYHASPSCLTFDQILEHACENFSAFSSEAHSVECMDLYTKTLFLQFKNDENLSNLNQSLSKACGVQSDYSFDPHLSLLYHSLNNEQRKMLKEKYQSLTGPIEFSQVKVIETPMPMNSKVHVESWKTIASISLD